MGISQIEFEELVRAKFPESSFELRSTTGDDEHYELVIRSSRFKGLSRVAQHQLVYKEIGIMSGQLHALSLSTIAVE